MRARLSIFRNDCAGLSFTIQILEIFSGTGYINNKVCPVERAKRLKCEYRPKTNIEGPFIFMAQMNKQEKHDREVPVGKLFFSIPRTSNEVPDIETTMII